MLKRLAIFILFLFLTLSIFAPKTQINNSLEVWSSQGDDWVRWQNFRELFGSSEFIVVSIEAKKNIFTIETLRFLLSLEQDLAKLHNIEQVVGPGSLFQELVGLEDIQEEIYPEDVTLWQKELTESSFYQNMLIHSQKKRLGIFIYPQDLHHSATNRRQMTQEIRGLLTKHQNSNYVLRLAGSPILNAGLDECSQTTSKTLMPLVFLVMVLWLYFLFSSWWLIFSMILPLGVSITALLGAMVYSQIDLNMITVAMPAVLLILGGANTIHILHTFAHKFQDMDAKSAALQTREKLFKPCIYATLTTSAGFFSLLLSPIDLIQELGLLTGVGLLLGLAANLYLTPWMLSNYKGKKPKTRKILDHLAYALGRVGVRKPKWTLVLILIVATVFLVQLPNFRIESNVLKFLPEEHKVSQDYHDIGQNLTGLFSIELEVSCSEVKNIPWQWLDQAMEEIGQNPHIKKVYGPTLWLKKANAAYHDSQQHYKIESDSAIDGYIVSFHGLAEQEWQRIVKDYGKKMAFSLLISSLDGEDYQSILDAINQQVAKAPKDIQIEITGIVAVVNENTDNVVYTQIYSFPATALLICGLFFVFLPWRMAAIALPVNLLPPLASFATMVLWDIPLNIGTVMIASIAIGIAVDDTIHFLFSYQSAKTTSKEPIQEALANSGAPIVATSTTIIFGFCLLAFAEFLPIGQFGVLTAYAVFIALLSDLILLPALITLIFANKSTTIEGDFLGQEKEKKAGL